MNEIHVARSRGNSLRRARGVVVVNSTVGLSAIYHGTPVHATGFAVYDIPGLTAQVPLDSFWCLPGSVDQQLYRRFRRYLVDNVLGNGSFYRPIGAGPGATGVAWPHGSITAASAPERGLVGYAAPRPPREIGPEVTTVDLAEPAHPGYVAPSMTPPALPVAVRSDHAG